MMRQEQCPVGESQGQSEPSRSRKFLSMFDCVNILRVFGQSRQNQPQPKRSFQDPSAFLGAGDSLSAHHEIKEILLKKCSCVEQKVKNFTPQKEPKNVRVHLNGKTLPSSCVLTEKYQTLAEILLERAINSPNVVFPIITTNNRVIHVQDGNSCSNWKFVTVLPISIKCTLVSVIKTPKRILFGFLVADHNNSLYSLNTPASSSTQTDIFDTGCYSNEMDIYNGFFNRGNEPNTNEIVSVASKMVGVSSISLRSYANHSNKSIMCSKTGANWSTSVECLNEKAFGVNKSCCNSGESDDEPRSHFLSRIIRYSQVPHKAVSSQDVVITYFNGSTLSNLGRQPENIATSRPCCVTCCDSELCEDSSYELKDINQANNSHKPYFLDRKNFEFDIGSIAKNSIIYSTDDQGICLQKPPEISSSNSHLSFEQKKVFFSPKTGYSSPENYLGSCTKGYNPLKMESLEYDIADKYENYAKSKEELCTSDNQKGCSTDVLELSRNPQQNSSCIRSRGLPKHTQEKFQMKKVFEFNRTGKQRNACDGPYAAALGFQEKHETENTKTKQNYWENSNIGFGEMIRSCEKDNCSLKGVASTSEDEHRFQYEHNLEVMKIKARRKKVVYSSSSTTSLPLAHGKVGYNQTCKGKSKHKLKQINCPLM